MQKTKEQMKAAAATLTKLAGQPVTIITYGDMGFLYAIQAKIQRVAEEKYAQYDSSLGIWYLPKGRRKKAGLLILPYKDLLVVSGWEPVEAAMFVGGGNRSLLCFSPEYMEIARQSAKGRILLDI